MEGIRFSRKPYNCFEDILFIFGILQFYYKVSIDVNFFFMYLFCFGFFCLFCEFVD